MLNQSASTFQTTIWIMIEKLTQSPQSQKKHSDRIHKSGLTIALSLHFTFWIMISKIGISSTAKINFQSTKRLNLYAAFYTTLLKKLQAKFLPIYVRRKFLHSCRYHIAQIPFVFLIIPRHMLFIAGTPRPQCLKF